jgi:hypothetical protein
MRGDIAMEIGILDMVQRDGRAPTVLVAGSAPGESVSPGHDDGAMDR